MQNVPDPDCNFGYVIGERLKAIENKLDNKAKDKELKNFKDEIKKEIQKLSHKTNDLYEEIHVNGYVDEIENLKRILKELKKEREKREKEEKKEKEKKEKRKWIMKKETKIAVIAGFSAAVFAFCFGILSQFI